MCVQISRDLEHSMNGTFSKYGGDEADTKAVDFLQAQVGVFLFLLLYFVPLHNFFFACHLSQLFTFISLCSPDRLTETHCILSRWPFLHLFKS